MKNIVDIKEFFVEGTDRSVSHVLLHITEPTTPQEREKGYFFALCEIEGGELEQIEHLQKLIDDIEYSYYETSEDAEHTKNAFEITLEFINRRSAHLLSDNITLHCLVGIIRGNELSFATHGSPHAIVMYKQGNDISTMNILEGQEDSGESIFSAVIEGNVNEGDTIFLGTPHVTNHFPYDRIKTLVSTKSNAQVISHIEGVLKDLKGEYSFGGLLCHVKKNTTRTQTKKKATAIGSADSINKLLSSERETSQTLAPPLFGGIRKKKQQSRKASRQGTLETNYRKRAAESTGGLTTVILVGFGRGLVTLGISLWKFFNAVFRITLRFFLMLFILITNKNNGRKDVWLAFEQTWNNMRNWFFGLPLMSRLLFIATILLAINFFVSIGTLRLKDHYAEKEQQYTAQIQAVEDKIAAAEARLIYNDDDSAFALLKEAKELAVALPQDKKSQKNTAQTLLSRVEQTLIDLQNITMIEPTILVDLTTQGENVQATRLTRIDDAIVAYGKDDARIYFVDKDTAQISSLPHDTVPHIIAANTPKEHDSIFFTTADNALFVYDKDTKAISKQDISFPNDIAGLSDPFIYNLRLYIVDKQNNQLYKHGKTQTGFERGSPWIQNTSDIDISDAVSLAIDGDIFILKQSGNILKFSAGQREPFTIANLDPALDNPTDIYTYNDVTNIYILEPTHKRVVVLEKNGKLKTQYTSDQWQNPTGMVVDEAKKTIYVLDSNVIYNFTF